MDLKGVKEAFNEVFKNQELVASSYKEAIDKVENEIKEAIKKIQSVDHPSVGLNKSVVTSLKQALERIWPQDQRLKQPQKELNKSFTKYPKILSIFADPDISDAHRNVDFDSGAVNQVVIASLYHEGFDDVVDSFIQEFAKNHLFRLEKTHQNELNDLLGWMGLHIEPENSDGSQLLSQVTQEELVKEMTNQFLSMRRNNLLRVTIEAGARALPTLLKLTRVMSLNKMQEWETMKKLPVAIDLGSEFQFHSVFVCPVTGEESVMPYILQCRHVISLEAIYGLSKDLKEEFKCPLCEKSLLKDEDGTVMIECIPLFF